ncbi:MAG: hypothetical protein M3322_00755 [Actinomycetota bacterium]|nr:hypothetical protein [Actinomycetota bacterium]
MMILLDRLGQGERELSRLFAGDRQLGLSSVAFSPSMRASSICLATVSYWYG